MIEVTLSKIQPWLQDSTLYRQYISNDEEEQTVSIEDRYYCELPKCDTCEETSKTLQVCNYWNVDYFPIEVVKFIKENLDDDIIINQLLSNNEYYSCKIDTFRKLKELSKNKLNTYMAEWEPPSLRKDYLIVANLIRNIAYQNWDFFDSNSEGIGHCKAITKNCICKPIQNCDSVGIGKSINVYSSESIPNFESTQLFGYSKSVKKSCNCKYVTMNCNCFSFVKPGDRTYKNMYGHLNILSCNNSFFVKNNEIYFLFADDFKSSICNIAAYVGDIKLLKLLYEKGYGDYSDKSEVVFGHLENSICKIAAENGHLDCLKYLHETSHPWDKKTCEYAAENGHLDCLKYAHENGCEWNWVGRHGLLCLNAKRNGHLDCVKYAEDNGYYI